MGTEIFNYKTVNECKNAIRAWLKDMHKHESFDIIDILQSGGGDIEWGFVTSIYYTAS